MSNALPSPQEAHDALYQGIHNRVFFHKLAAAGYHPRSREEAAWMLETGAKLHYMTEAQQVKQAAAQDNPFFQMNRYLDQVASQHGIDFGTKQAAAQEAEVGIKKAAAALAEDPAIYNAVLALRTHQANDDYARYEAWKAGQK